MILIGVLAAIVTLWGGGAALALGFLSRTRRVNVLEMAGLGWIFGVGLISLGLWSGSFFCSGPVLQAVIALLAVSSGVAGWRKAARAGVSFSLPQNLSRWEIGLAILLCAEIVVIFVGSARHTLGWDGLLVWEIKARYAFMNGGAIPPNYFRDADRLFSHPDYPLAIPLTQLWIYLWAGEANQFWAKLIFPIFYATGVVLLALGGARLTNNRSLGLALAVLLFFVPQVSVATGGTLVGYADVPLALCYAAAVIYLLRPNRDSYAIFGALLVLLPWMKREGAILWIVAALAAAVVFLVHKCPLRTWLTLLPSLVLLVSWKIYLQQVSAAGSADFGAVSVATLRANLPRFVPVWANIIQEMIAWPNWGVFWLLMVIVLARLLMTRRSIVTAILFAAVVLPICLYSATYIFSAWPNYVDHVNASIPRLLVHVVPLGFILAGVAAQPSETRTRSSPDSLPTPGPAAAATSGI